MKGDNTTKTMDFTVDTAKTCFYAYRIFPLGADGQPVAYRLDGSKLVGRKEGGADFVIDDPMLSRVHAEVRRASPGPYVVVDRDSKNGVFVNGIRVRSASVGNGDVIRMGGSILVIREVGLNLPEAPSDEAGFVAFSPKMRLAEEACRRAAPTATTVLLTGETGTGKEVLASHVHACSGRKGRFMAVNCSAISPHLFESTLFGHKKGAFTGADRDFEGMIRAADGGTLFLDEIGELPADAQAKFLRFLESREFTPVGAVQSVKVDARVIAATNLDLEQAIEAGQFRKDLFARLSQWHVRLPALRDRPEDVMILVERQAVAAGLRLAPDAAEALSIHDWPFNVREVLALGNEWKLVGSDDGLVTLAMLPESVRQGVVQGRDIGNTDDDDRDGKAPTGEDLTTLFKQCQGNVSEMARCLGKDRRQVYRWLKKHGLKE